MGSLVCMEPCSIALSCLKYPSLLIAIGCYIIKGLSLHLVYACKALCKL